MSSGWFLLLTVWDRLDFRTCPNSELLADLNLGTHHQISRRFSQCQLQLQLQCSKFLQKHAKIELKQGGLIEQC